MYLHVYSLPGQTKGGRKVFFEVGWDIQGEINP